MPSTMQKFYLFEVICSKTTPSTNISHILTYNISNVLSCIKLNKMKNGGYQFNLCINLFNYYHNVEFLQTFVCNRNAEPKWFRIMVWDNGLHFRFYVAQVRYLIILIIVKFMCAVTLVTEINFVLDSISRMTLAISSSFFLQPDITVIAPMLKADWTAKYG